jgi:hypothetical protein
MSKKESKNEEALITHTLPSDGQAVGALAITVILGL